MDWVCGDAWRAALTQSLFYAGGVVGTLFFGYTADRFGRVRTVLASNALMGASGLATPFCADFASFCAVRFAMGLSHVTFFATFLLLGGRASTALIRQSCHMLIDHFFVCLLECRRLKS